MLRIGSSVINQTRNCDLPAPKTSLALGDLLARLPEVNDHYRIGKQKCVVHLAVDIEQRSIRVSKEREMTRAEANAVFEGTGFDFAVEGVQHYNYRAGGAHASPGLTDTREHLGIGTLWMTARYAGLKTYSKLSTLFATSFSLGMIVRYFPMQWTALIHGQFEDAALPTLAAAIDHIETTFPQIVLNFAEP
jgi:hypothetical protein